MNLFDFVECSNRTRSLPDLFNLLVKSAEDEGFGQVGYGALTYRELVRLPGHSAPWVAMSFPAQWRDRYVERKYHEIDPVVRRTPTMPGPFRWDRLAQLFRLEPGERLVLSEAYEAGLKHGVSVPLFGAWGRVAVVSFASSRDDVDEERRLSHLNALAAQFHVAFSEIAHKVENGRPVVQLSPRERDCLSWAAEGKSSWDISIILAISENTVNFHIKNAMKKLRTTSRMVAVVKAIRLNLISTPE
jgi:DNA-binding CsgD family transcriptional regulator